MTSDPKPAFIFAHGAWHDSKTWTSMCGSLEALGYDTHALDLVSSGIRERAPKGHLDDAALIRRKVEEVVGRDGKNVVLVAHSYGGLPMSEAVEGLERVPGERELGVVACLFVTAFMVPRGESLVSINTAWRKEMGLTSLPAGRQVLKENPDYYINTTPYEELYDDIPIELAQPLIDALKPQPLSVSRSTVVSEAWRFVPCTFVVCVNDKIFLPALQRRFIEEAGKNSKFPIRVHEMSSAHTPFLLHNEELVKIARKVAGEKL